VHASRATGKDDHISALAGTTDVQGHSVGRGNSQLIHVYNPAGKVVDCSRTSAAGVAVVAEVVLPELGLG
jgi:hypothetical protein